MQIGVLTALFNQDPIEEVLDRVRAMGITAVEIGTRTYPHNKHIDLNKLISDDHARKSYAKQIADRGMIISALSCHSNPIHPNPKIAQKADQLFRKTVRLVEMMSIPVVNTFSGLPAGCEGDHMPNWVTCPWPTHFQDMLKYQWDEIAIPYWQEAACFAADHGVKIGIEMHPGMLIFNVETLLRMREAAGPALGTNFDPSHLFWNGVDPAAAIRKLGPAIHHVHGKDCIVDPFNTAVNGCLDHKPYDQVSARSWTFRTIGYGHDVKIWKDIISALRMVGYDHVISIEHEDCLMSAEEGLIKAVRALQEIMITQKADDMFWA